MYIALDIGGTKTEIGFYANKNFDSVLKSQTFPTNQSFDKAIAIINSEIDKSAGEKIEGIGVSFPGIVDAFGNIIQGSNIRDYENKPLKKLLEKYCVDVRIAQDSACSAIAELIFGNVNAYKRIVHLIIGTGLGGTLMEVGTKTVISPIEPCGMIIDFYEGRYHESCKTPGLLEAYTGGGTLEKFYNVKLANTSDDDELWDDVTDYLAAGINNINCILKPEIVVIGGGIGLKRKSALASVIEKVKQYNEFVSPPTVEFTSVEGNSSILGALALFSVKNLEIRE